jgi:hypothetical protein
VEKTLAGMTDLESWAARLLVSRELLELAVAAWRASQEQAENTDP